ncbi:MAG: DUF4350 domain-containing protein [Candidatus Hydrogenedentes bacterium]|nr:DUF4350 domain-containing protein [Candidatus Hydrogenedentota bacterium]
MENKATVAGALLVGGLFLAALYHLLSLQYESGDAYPPYSSFRSDPVGTRALFEALGALDGVSVRRNLAPIETIGPGDGRTLLFAGSTLSEDPESVVEALETFAADGGRLVIAFSDSVDLWGFESDTDEEKADADQQDEVQLPPDDTSEEEGSEDAGSEEAGSEEEGAEEDEADAKRESFLLPPVSIAKRWGFRYDRRDLPTRDPELHGEDARRTKAADERLPEVLRWHTRLYFDDVDEAWTKIYVRPDAPVVMERPWGAGSIVVLSGSYHLSNEAMRSERSAALLAWLVGRNAEVIFDERHLGVGERPGIMALALRYRLGGLIAGLLLVTGLFIWKSVVSLAPKTERPAEAFDAAGGGQGASVGLSNLLRRSIPKSDLLAVCVEEWDRSARIGPAQPLGARERLRAVVEEIDSLPPRRRDPAEGYRRIYTILTERKRGL